MQQNNASTTANLEEENMLLNLSRTMTNNYKNYTESSSIEKISEQKNTGLPIRTAEPASGYFLSGCLGYSFELVLFLDRRCRRIV